VEIDLGENIAESSARPIRDRRLFRFSYLEKYLECQRWARLARWRSTPPTRSQKGRDLNPISGNQILAIETVWKSLKSDAGSNSI